LIRGREAAEAMSKEAAAGLDSILVEQCQAHLRCNCSSKPLDYNSRNIVEEVAAAVVVVVVVVAAAAVGVRTRLGRQQLWEILWGIEVLRCFATEFVYP
jgi:hypothetical protein